VFDRASLIKVK